ncbi:hypothetical protein [Acinetobacter sp. YH12043]|uniref:hypothetical protein n=1 Tax=Acinetobacter sp. YH12043 TaxID=2601050 RepID=UPI0015D0D49A|nr:hypothetical protein [Acinetobacter sp. YH12043]
MNIFEKYGGYEAVKQAAVNYKNSGDRVTAAGLELQCLEYRRQHNIFEVGDYFCYESKYLSNDPVDGDAYKKLNQLDSIDFECGWVESALKRGGIIRHATDEEIKAGKRLPD